MSNYSRGNFRNNYNQGYNNGGNRSNYNSNYNQGQGQRQVKKHSGATKGVDKNGNQYFRGWNFSRRRGMLTVLIVPYKKSGEHTSKSGKTYTNLMAKVNYNDSGVEKLMGALLSHQTGKVTIPELGMVLNPSAPNGGYFGTFSK